MRWSRVVWRSEGEWRGIYGRCCGGSMTMSLFSMDSKCSGGRFLSQNKVGVLSFFGEGGYEWMWICNRNTSLIFFILCLVVMLGYHVVVVYVIVGLVIIFMMNRGWKVFLYYYFPLKNDKSFWTFDVVLLENDGANIWKIYDVFFYNKKLVSTFYELCCVFILQSFLDLD